MCITEIIVYSIANADGKHVVFGAAGCRAWIGAGVLDEAEDMDAIKLAIRSMWGAG